MKPLALALAALFLVLAGSSVDTLAALLLLFFGLSLASTALLLP